MHIYRRSIYTPTLAPARENSDDEHIRHNCSYDKHLHFVILSPKKTKPLFLYIGPTRNPL